MNTSPFLLYGSTGYTGDLIARRAKELGMQPILAGRSADKLAAQSERLGFPWKAFSLDDAHALHAALEEVPAVLHCAGPFSHTYKAMAEACLGTRTHYLDITGEIEVFEGLQALNTKAKMAGVQLLPGAGFDVVPTDCLAARLAEALPGADSLELAFLSVGGGLSHGTAKTAVENLHVGSLGRRDGRIVPLAGGGPSRKIDFGRGPVLMSSIPWGDVSTAFHSTRIPNITTYTFLPGSMRFLRKIGPVMGLTKADWVQNFLKRQIEKQPAGPNEEQLAKGKTLVWGEVCKGNERREGRVTVPQGYELTAQAALRLTSHVLDGKFQEGFQTPSSAYGWQFLDECPGVKWDFQG